MPDGFRGNATGIYLNAVDDALGTARDAHDRSPFSFSVGVSRVVPLPQLPHRANVRTPHLPETAHSGAHSTGYGNSRNIVIANDEYDSIVTEITSIDMDVAEELDRVVRDIEALCETSFVMPLTTMESMIIALGVRNSLNDFRALTDEKLSQLRNLMMAIMDIS